VKKEEFCKMGLCLLSDPTCLLGSSFMCLQLGRRRVKNKETVIPDPDYRIPVVFLGGYRLFFLYIARLYLDFVSYSELTCKKILINIAKQEILSHKPGVVLGLLISQIQETREFA